MYHRDMEREIFEYSGVTGAGDQSDEDIGLRYAYRWATRGKVEGKRENVVGGDDGAAIWRKEPYKRSGIMMSMETAGALMS